MKTENITVRRAPRDGQHPYMQLYRKVPQDLSLSLEERGLLIYILSLPLTWIENIEDMGKKNGVGRNKIRQIINNLKKAGYCYSITRKDSKGRFHSIEYLFSEEKITQATKDEYIETDIPPTSTFEPETENRGLVSGARIQGSGPLENPVEKTPSHNTLDNNLVKSKDIPPTPVNGEAAKAADVPVSSSLVSPEAKQLAADFVSAIKEVKPDYKPPAPKAVKLWEQAAQKLIVEDKRDPAKVLMALKWALRDNEDQGKWKGWYKVFINKSNPVHYMIEKYDTLDAGMTSKKKREFLPSSDDNAALRMAKAMYGET